MTTVGYARVSSTGQDLTVQLEKLAGCDKVVQEKRSGIDAGRPALKACLEYLRQGDTLLVTKLDRLARSTPDLYRIVSALADNGVAALFGLEIARLLLDASFRDFQIARYESEKGIIQKKSTTA